MTDAMTSHDLADAVFRQLEDMVDDLDGQVLVSQARCVDHLLDLRNLTTNPVVTAVIDDVIADIHRLTVVEADEMAGHYAVLGAVASVEAAFEAESER